MTTPPVHGSPFETLRTDVLRPDLVDRLARGAGKTAGEVERWLRIALAEAEQTLHMLDGVELRGRRLLELGSELGLTSCHLTRIGHDVTSLEPGGPGFEWYGDVIGTLIEELGAPHDLVAIGAESLDRAEHGQFDVAFSNNVIEHVEDPVEWLRSVAGVLTTDGVMIHSCPNYSVPYEPHFGIPLVPMRPASTARLLPARITGSGLWMSLNFIRLSDVESAAEGMGMEATFNKGLLADSLGRLLADEEFAARHRLLAGGWRMVQWTGIAGLLRRIPPRFATPMSFTLKPSGRVAG